MDFYIKTENLSIEKIEEIISKKYIYIFADIQCPHCGKNQSVISTKFLGGPCVKCGEMTIIND